MSPRILGLVWSTVALLGTTAGAASLPTTQPASLSVIHRQWIPAGFHAIRELAYASRSVHSQSLDLYVPDVSTAPRPLMVWIHGGGWNSGDKAYPPGLGLLLRGYVVASINYRLTREALFPAQIYDCKAAIRFLRAHAGQYGIDRNRIGVWGDSAGGQLASLLGTTNGLKEYEGFEGIVGVSSNVQAVCDWFGPSDFLQSKDWTGSGGNAVNQLFGGFVTLHSDNAILASPARQAGRAPLVPFLIMHGEQDPIVPVHQSRVLFDRLQLLGGSARLVILPHTGHGYGWFRSRDDLGMVYDFFDRCFRTPSRNLTTTRPSN